MTIGRYEIERELRAGLYEARDPDRARTVALAVLEFATPELAEQFRRAAQPMIQLGHHNVVAVFEVGGTGTQAFVAMELVPGGTLREWLAVPHPLNETLGVFLQISAGVAAAHDAGVVRDFDPDSVIVGTDGVVRVGGFGFAGTHADQHGFAVALSEAMKTTENEPRRLARAIARGLSNDPYPTMRAFGSELHAILTAPADRFIRTGRAVLLALVVIAIGVVLALR